jgi:hypothetical protein
MGLHMAQKTVYVDIASALVLVAASSFLFITMDSYIDQGLPAVIAPSTFPRFITVIVIVFSFLFLCHSILVFFKGHASDACLHSRQREGENNRKGFYIYVAILSTYYLTFDILGFLVSTPPAMLATAKLLGEKRTLLPIAGFILFTIAVDQLFFRTMSLELPPGILSFM